MRRLALESGRATARWCSASSHFAAVAHLTTSCQSLRSGLQESVVKEKLAQSAVLVVKPGFVVPPLSGHTRTNVEPIKAHFDLPLPVTNHLIPTIDHGQKGLLLYPSLSSPQSLRRLTERTLVHGAAIVSRIIRAPQDPTTKELRLVIKNLDRLSDLLCGVIDMCEMIRNVHPDKAWVDESEKAYSVLCGFMNELNANKDMYESLSKTVSHPYANNPLSPAELRVAETFLSDFERSGIRLPPQARERFIKHSDTLLSLGRSFLSSALSGSTPTPPIEITNPHHLLVGLGRQFVDSLPRKHLDGPALVAPGSWEAHMISRYARDGEARRLVYTGSMRKDEGRIRVLEDMLKKRAELADVLGKKNWAEVVLEDKMAKNPENVMKFLNSLNQHHLPVAKSDLAKLQRKKASALTGNHYDPHNPRTSHLPPFYAWDKDYYGDRHISSLHPSGSPSSFSPYFSVGTALSGLSQIFTKLYGISFRPVDTLLGETWHPSVRRLDIVDEMEGTIGFIYCDLYSRPGKSPGAAHFTVRCSRRVDDDDLEGDGLPENWGFAYGPGLEVEGKAVPGRQGRYQLPIVALSADFGTVEEDRPALLSWNDLETLFHEMGHAIHSMVGRTEFHNVSGTRCATDFVELPSIFMEFFVSSPQILATFATHFSTGEPLPTPLIQAHLSVNQALAALETQSQITMALLDQRYHALRHRDPTFDSTSIWHQLQREVGVTDPVPETAWQIQFGHLYGYGATYYSYLFDRAIAGKIWSTLFAHPGTKTDSREILTRERGEEFKNKVLKWGGGKNPWEMVGDIVGGQEGEYVSKGDERALAIVGSWMIK
ncbi:uncharacterized protein L203_100423 [Cryptococcus depauperatus CBS 7841]|uniref:Mitochondrial intermediate peptidase 1 n=1 Tax=Cryptococcus depauperatus CBS 7841 TaxID=1295531 RepID=A0A1E3HY64_9TREE|nr:mitochondrial intermediate peptidase 2 [Cryptococcus depauperatus CBS 7841]